jgi:hypothetical protein
MSKAISVMWFYRHKTGLQLQSQLYWNIDASNVVWKLSTRNFTFCWPCISLQTLGNNQLDAIFHVYIYFMSLHVSGVTALIIRRSHCVHTSSGMISLCKWLLGMPVRRDLTRTNHTRLCINTIRSPDDERCSLLTGIPSSHLHRLIIPDDVLIQFDLLMMIAVTLETCRDTK